MGHRRKKRRNRGSGERGGSSLPPLCTLAHENLIDFTRNTTEQLPADLFLIGLNGGDLLKAPIDDSRSFHVEDVLSEEEAVHPVHRMAYMRFMQVPEVPGFVELCLHRGVPELSGYGVDREATLSLMGLCFQIRLAIYRDALRQALCTPELRIVNRMTALRNLQYLEGSTYLVGMEPFCA